MITLPVFIGISFYDYRVSIFIKISILSSFDNVNMIYNKRAAHI